MYNPSIKSLINLLRLPIYLHMLKNIFNSDFVFIGVGVAPHGTYRQCCVIDYAGEVTDIGDDDHIAAKGVSAPKKKAAPKATHEESKVVGDGYVKNERFCLKKYFTLAYCKKKYIIIYF